MDRSRSVIIGAIIICGLTIAVYSNTFHSSFCFDDDPSIVNNASIQNLGNLKAIWDFWPTRFVTYLTFAVNYHFHKLDVSGYHAVNLAIHMTSSLLVWYLVFITFSTPAMREKEISRHAHLIAFFAGLLFAVHPIQTGAVTYIVQRAASLATLFYLASLILYIKSRMVASFIAAVITMFTKEMTFTLPLSILLYEVCFMNSGGRARWRRVAPFLATLLIIPATMFFTKSVDFGEMERIAEGPMRMTSHDYLLTQFRVIVTYIRLIFIPLNQNLDYDYPITAKLLGLPTLASILVLAAVLIAAFKLFSRHRLMSFGIFWFFLTLMPESSFIPIKDVIFEHRLYLPMVGFSFFLVSALYYLLGIQNLKIAALTLISIIMAYSILTYMRNNVWKDMLTLWNDTVMKSPNKARPRYNRGVAYAAIGKRKEAIADYDKAIAINPHYKSAYYNRGNAYYDMANYGEAIADYNKVIAMNPGYAKTYYNRGNAYSDIGRYGEAVSDFTKVIEMNPSHTKAYNNRGAAYASEGYLDKAIADFDKAITINPNYGEAYTNRGTAYYYKKEFDKSIGDLTKAEKLGQKVDPRLLAELKRALGDLR